ncbi:RNAse R [Aliiroseovarius halocynthiae]|uniref:Ribonuclease R n=1 Tax=Aliiroseovarius halocynthiae TaxID=985055 RepID=A0A545SPA1_9RHOB|nr:ribonuclease R [Aliiroseovarius halocynthiae]TQV66812.1 ribonuclease R [Aliiroseovarius halocynthiae]SMR82354.1 RNAse R [Aliiroseovarius halocynthiae]
MSKLPTKKDILDWISENPTMTAKRDIARAFGIRGAARIDLKRILKELEAEGHLQKRKKTYRDADKLPPVSVLRIEGPDADGDLFAYPTEWTGEGAAPRVLLVAKGGDPALAQGERILARLTEVKGDGHAYEGRLIRRIGTNPQRILGIFRKGSEGGRIVPIDKGADKEWRVDSGADEGAKDGELVEAQQSGPKSRMGLPRARIVARLGDPTAPKAVSLIAIHQHGIPDAFPDKVIAEADAQKPAGLKNREDLRNLPLVTIDPADARDHDDAVYAHADDNDKNPGGHVVWVAIADVAHYVTPGSALDVEARKRGNSSYFPDRVVPMLPDRLSGDLCSLHEGVPRACLAVRMVLDAQGQKISHSFIRGLMKSHASLNYAEVQAAQDGAPNDKCAPLMDEVITPLYAAYRAAKLGREARQPLDLDLPERKIILGEDGKVASIAFAERFDAHKLIEEFMILANVAAAEELMRLQRPLLFRVHEEPSPEKLEALREVAQASGFTLAKGQVLQTRHLNHLLAQAEGTEFDELVNISTLRSMTQAYYYPQNFGHFGLSLKSYAHFTSPIRRYSDLIVHRALVSGHGWGDDGLTPQDVETLEATAKHISETERRSMLAERDTTDRYLAAYLSERVGGEFTGRISGIARFGMFVKLDESGADGLVPLSTLGNEYFRFNADDQTLTGERSNLTLGLGQRVVVRLTEAIPTTGGLALELLEVEGRKLPRVSARKGGKSGRRKPMTDAKRSAKIKRKVKRSRR